MLKNYYIRVVSTVLLISICCSLFGQTLLKLIELTSNYYKYLLILTPLILIFTKFSNLLKRQLIKKRKLHGNFRLF